MYFAARASSLGPYQRCMRPFLPNLTAGTVLSIVVFTTTCSHIAAQASEPYTLAVQPHVDQCTTYRGIVEVEGKVKWMAAAKRDAKSEATREQEAPLSIRGELTFDERLLEANPEQHQYRSARFYRHASVEYQLGKQHQQRELSDGQRLMVANLNGSKLTIVSPHEPLSQDELDLVDVPGCTLALPQLLPGDPVRIGESWDVPSAALAPLLGITSVAVSDLRATLERVEKDVALVTFRGSVSGRADGADTQMDVEGKLNVEVADRRIIWLAMSIAEQREVSDTLPGLEVKARVRLAAKASPEPVAELADPSLPEMVLQPESLTELVRVVSEEAGFEVLADRQWRVIVERHDGMILRCFDDGKLLAQVIIHPLPDGPHGKQLTMQALEEDVKETLQQHAGQIVERAEGAGENGLRVLRISAAGVVSEVSMQWVYYHVSNPEGRRIGLTFTVQSDLIEKFAQRDQAMVETLRFLPVTPQPVSTTAPADK